jgi:hypothetical protein
LAGTFSKPQSERFARRLANSSLMKDEIRGEYQREGEPDPWTNQTNDRANSGGEPHRSDCRRHTIGEGDSSERQQGHAEQRLSGGTHLRLAHSRLIR